LAPTRAAEAQTYKSVGVVKNIDPDAGKITVEHEEIPGYRPAMEMTEAVSDAKMLETVKIGDRVEFEFQRTESTLLITKLNKIGETALLNGGEIYKTNCAECHGGVGEGTSKGISFLKGHALKHSEKDFIEQVTDGDGDKMPAFKNDLSTEQIALVVKFIREDLQQKKAPKE
jgi:Cu(I)/Ag(I) efflux system protein CusF